MRLREFFRGQSNHDRKTTMSIANSSLIPVLDANTFVYAAQEKDTETLHKYLLAGFPPDQPDPSTRSTALHIAVESGNFRAIQMLLQAGAQVNVTDLSFSTPLHLAAYLGYEEIVQILLLHGADMYKQDNTGRNSFHLAVSTGNIRLIQHFLTANDESEQNIIHVPDAQNWTPLMCACASNHSAVCSFLLSHRADINARNNQGMNAFHLTAFLGSVNVLQELINSSQHSEQILLQAINQTDEKNRTPLFHACIEGHLEIALILLRSGANLYHLDNEDQTCLHAMLSSSIILKRHIRLFYHFIQYVDFRSYQDYLGRTLLDLAYLNQLNTIIYLLSLLNYQTNSNIVFNNEQIDTIRPKRALLSLRHISILKFKQSIIYQHQQLTQQELLINGLKQTFQLDQPKEQQIDSLAIGKSLDDISILQHQSTKYQKNTKTIKHHEKKIRKTASIFAPSTNKWSSQIDLQHQQTQSTWSTLANKFKGQRLPPVTANTQQISIDHHTHRHNPMKDLALDFLTSPMKIENLIDFPSLNNNALLDEDLKLSINTYQLCPTD